MVIGEKSYLFCEYITILFCEESNLSFSLCALEVVVLWNHNLFIISCFAERPWNVSDNLMAYKGIIWQFETAQNYATQVDLCFPKWNI